MIVSVIYPNREGANVGGQVDPEALATIDAFLAASPSLPVDVRRKILLSRDELELTVRIRRGGPRA